MEKEHKPTKVADDVIVEIEYTLRVDGEIVDSSAEEGPLLLLQGHGNVIPGLEKALYGMEIGESKKVSVAPQQGYGEYDEEAVVDIPRSEFPHEIPLKPGVELEVTDQEGHTQFASIVSLSKSDVKLDFNHPLAGKILDFDVTITDLRQPTKEELDHGHVHYHDHEHDDQEDFVVDESLAEVEIEEEFEDDDDDYGDDFDEEYEDEDDEDEDEDYDDLIYEDEDYDDFSDFEDDFDEDEDDIP